MIQTKLFPVEKKILKELWKYNYANSGIVCDVTLADKLKRGMEGGN